MPEIHVWTKQNAAVIEQLEANGRFIADERYIRRELDETTDVMLFIYRWLTAHSPNAFCKPPDVQFPVWVSFSEETTMIPEPGYVVLELSVDESMITLIDTAKWTVITNYSYIQADEKDAEDHRKIIDAMGIGNAEAVMSRFYPDIRKKIMESWDRLFDDSVNLGSDTKYGVIWEVKKEWIKKIIQ